MAEITLFGWFHTIIGITALVTGIAALAKYKLISLDQSAGRIYLVCTLITAATALFIFHQGGFNPAHILAILTLLALLVGALAEKKELFGKLSPYIQAISYSATFLFHIIPATTDGLMRLPTDAPIVTNIEDPLLRGFYLAFLVTFLIGVICQIVMLRKRAN
jgi:uncharacterized membrane protein